MNSRRNFIKQAGILGAVIAATPESIFAKSKSKTIGLQLYSLRDEIPKGLETVIAGIAKAGYDQVETYGFSNGQYFGMSTEDFGKLLKKYKLTSPSGHYGVDDLFKSGSFAELDAAISAAKILKQEYVTVPYIDEHLRKTSSDIDNIVSKINIGAKRVADAGLKMAYHSHSFEFDTIGGTSLYERLLSESDPKHLFFELDLYWAVRAKQDPLTWFKKYPGRFRMVHVKDMDKANHELTTEVGKGTINFREIFNDAKLAGIQYYIVEQENFSIPPFESIAQSAVALRNLLNSK